MISPRTKMMVQGQKNPEYPAPCTSHSRSISTERMNACMLILLKEVLVLSFSIPACLSFTPHPLSSSREIVGDLACATATPSGNFGARKAHPQPVLLGLWGDAGESKPAMLNPDRTYDQTHPDCAGTGRGPWGLLDGKLTNVLTHSRYAIL